MLFRSPEDDSLIIFTQHEKLLIELKDCLPEKISNYHLVIDEMPHNKFRTFTSNQLDRLIKTALPKDPNEYSIDEYQAMKNFDTKEIEAAREGINNSKDDHILEWSFKVSIHTNGSYISPHSVMHQEKTISPLFELFNNTIILTTEVLPCAFLEQLGYIVYEEIITDELKLKIQTLSQEMEICILPLIDTTKKNTLLMSKYIKMIKENNPSTFIVGKKALGCDGTFESVKGSNKFWLDDKINMMHIIASPRHPNEVYDYLIHFKKSLGEKSPDEFLRLLIEQKCCDDFNQVAARLLGVRKIRSGKKSKIVYYLSKSDNISLNAVKRSRYTPSNINYSEVVLKESLNPQI